MILTNLQLAQKVVDSGAIAHLALLKDNKDAKLKVWILCMHACIYVCIVYCVASSVFSSQSNC